MKIKKLLTLIAVLLLYIIPPVYAQTATKINLDSIPGTWSGMIVKSDNEGNAKMAAHVNWRISQVNQVKNKIVIAEALLKFNIKDTVALDREGAEYTFSLKDTALVIQLKDMETSNLFSIQLNMEKQEGYYILKGDAEEKAGKVHYGLFKVDSNTTNVIPKMQLKPN